MIKAKVYHGEYIIAKINLFIYIEILPTKNSVVIQDIFEIIVIIFR